MALALARHATAAAETRSDRVAATATTEDIASSLRARLVEDEWRARVAAHAATDWMPCKAKPRRRPNDRECYAPKARQGWNRVAMREERVRTCVGCDRMLPTREMIRVARLLKAPRRGGGGSSSDGGDGDVTDDGDATSSSSEKSNGQDGGVWKVNGESDWKKKRRQRKKKGKKIKAAVAVDASSLRDEVRSIHWSPYDRVGVVNAVS